MGITHQRGDSLSRLVTALAAQAVAIQAELDDASAIALHRFVERIEATPLNPASPLLRAIRPPCLLLDDFEVEIDLQTEIRRTTGTEVGLQIFGRTVSSFLRIVTGETETEDLNLELTVTPVPVEGRRIENRKQQRNQKGELKHVE
jgi:hypothetical protein